MKIEPTELAGVFMIEAEPFGDARGLFADIYDAAVFKDAGIADDYIQDAVTRSTKKGTVRGLHFQRPPFAQSKLVRVQKGAVFDVVLDLRPKQPTYGRHITLELTDKNWRAVRIPVGCAHGFCTLAEGTEVVYKIAGAYSADHGDGILWHDPDLGIDWPLDAEAVTVSERDTKWPRLSDRQDGFDW